MSRCSLLGIALLAACTGLPLVDEEAPLQDPLAPGYHHVGQGTHLIVWGTEGILTDPRDYAELPTDPSLVLITERLDRRALSRLDKSATLVVPPGQLKAAAKLGFAGVQAAGRGQVRGFDLEVRRKDGRVAYRLSREGRAILIAGQPRTAAHLGHLGDAVDLAILPASDGTKRSLSAADAVALARRSGVRTVILTHRPPAEDYPDDFVVPRAGQRILFPWDRAQVGVQ